MGQSPKRGRVASQSQLEPRFEAFSFLLLFIRYQNIYHLIFLGDFSCFPGQARWSFKVYQHQGVHTFSCLLLLSLVLKYVPSNLFRCLLLRKWGRVASQRQLRFSCIFVFFCFCLWIVHFGFKICTILFMFQGFLSLFTVSKYVPSKLFRWCLLLQERLEMASQRQPRFSSIRFLLSLSLSLVPSKLCRWYLLLPK